MSRLRHLSPLFIQNAMYISYTDAMFINMKPYMVLKRCCMTCLQHSFILHNCFITIRVVVKFTNLFIFWTSTFLLEWTGSSEFLQEWVGVGIKTVPCSPPASNPMNTTFKSVVLEMESEDPYGSLKHSQGIRDFIYFSTVVEITTHLVCVWGGLLVLATY